MNELNHLELEQASGGYLISAAVRVAGAFMAGATLSALAKKLYDKATAQTDDSDEM